MKRGRTWRLEVYKVPCRCGAQASFFVNTNGDRLLCRHDAPDGRPCPAYGWQVALECARKLAELAGVIDKRLYSYGFYQLTKPRGSTP